jgi:hypothetical protein
MDKKSSNLLAIDTVLMCLARNPYRHLVKRWNWKSACLSALTRGALILMANLPGGAAGALGAMLAETGYRTLTSGFHGAVNQAFRQVRPIWLTSAVSMFFLPAISDGMEWTMHYARGTQRLGATIAASTIFTSISTLFELFAMRRGVFVIGAAGGSMKQDLKKIPSLIFAFLWEGTRGLVTPWRRSKSGGAAKSDILKRPHANARRHAGPPWPELNKPLSITGSDTGL